MNPNPPWHADQNLRAMYAADTLSRSQAASVESHMMSCASCRAAMTGLLPPDRLTRNLDSVLDSVDQPRRPRFESVVALLGVPEHVARLLAISPSERGPWFAGVVMAFLVAVAAEALGAYEDAFFALLVMAPLLPLAGVTVATTFRRDPLGELVTAVATPAFSLFLMRALAVVAPTIVVAVSAAMLTPGDGWESVLWLLPSFGLMMATLALGSWFPIRAVAWVLGAAWVTAAAIGANGAPAADLVAGYAPFRPVGQLALFALSLIAGAVAVARSDSFDLIEIRRTS